MNIDTHLVAQLGAVTPEAHERAWLDFVRQRFEAATQPERRLIPAKSFGELPVRAASQAWLVERLFPRHGVAIIAGIPKARKSWLALDVALAVASGQPLLGARRVERGPVLYIALEDQEEDIRSRLLALGAGRGLSPEQLATQPLWICAQSQLNLVEPETLHATIARGLMALQRSHPHELRFSLIVIDPLRDAHNANEDSSTEMRGVLRTLRDLQRAFGGLVLLPHHLSKGSGRQGGSDWDKVRGSGAILGSVDVAVRVDDVEAPTPERLTATIHRINRAGRGSPPFAVTLDVRDEDDVAVHAKWTEQPIEVADASLADDMKMICDVLAGHPDGLAMSKLRDVTNRGDPQVKRAVAALGARVAVTPRGKRVKIVRLAAPTP